MQVEGVFCPHVYMTSLGRCVGVLGVGLSRRGAVGGSAGVSPHESAQSPGGDTEGRLSKPPFSDAVES